MKSNPLAPALAACLLLAACSPSPEEPVSPGNAAAQDAGADEDLHEPAEDVPPATAPRPAAPGALDFAGFGAAPFGTEAEAVRMAWGGPMQGQADQSDPDACYYLRPEPRDAAGFGIGFMIEGGRFVRADVEDAATVAPGGGRVGMEAGDIGTLYPGRVEEQAHKYVEGARYLRVRQEGAEAVLLFETDAEGRVDAWRIGLPPQVDYVERCG